MCGITRILDPLSVRKYLDPVGNSAIGKKIDPLGPAALANRYQPKPSPPPPTLLTPVSSDNSVFGGG